MSSIKIIRLLFISLFLGLAFFSKFHNKGIQNFFTSHLTVFADLNFGPPPPPGNNPPTGGGGGGAGGAPGGPVQPPGNPPSGGGGDPGNGPEPAPDGGGGVIVPPDPDSGESGGSGEGSGSKDSPPDPDFCVTNPLNPMCSDSDPGGIDTGGNDDPQNVGGAPEPTEPPPQDSRSRCEIECDNIECGSYNGCGCGSCGGGSSCQANSCVPNSSSQPPPFTPTGACLTICQNSNMQCGDFQGCNCGSCTSGKSCSDRACVPVGGGACTKPAKPTLLTPTTSQIEAGEVLIRWTPISGATGYALRINDTIDGFAGYNAKSPDLVMNNLTSANYVYKSAVAGRTYEVWVHAVNHPNTGCNAWSDTQTYTFTAVAPKPTSPPPVVRPALCSSATISKNTLGYGESLTITSTANISNVKGFTYRFLNKDNLGADGTPLPIRSAGSDVVTVAAGSNTATKTITVPFTLLDRPDANWKDQHPKNIQVNAYFTNQSDQFSAADGKCVVSFSIVQPTPKVTQAPLPTLTLPPKCGLLPMGDADCNDKVEAIDFEIWLDVFQKLIGKVIVGGYADPMAPATVSDPDFSRDGKIDLVDFEIWRSYKPALLETLPGTPTLPPNCVWKQVQCFTMPCDPIMECTSPTATPSAVPTVPPRVDCEVDPTICSSIEYCNGANGMCVRKIKTGDTCQTNIQCGGGFCAGGICNTAACSPATATCTISGTKAGQGSCCSGLKCTNGKCN